MTKALGKYYLSDDNEFILNRFEDVNSLLKMADWVKDRDAETMRRAMSHSLNYAIFETGTDRLVGFARVITDHATMYYLCDVFIDEEFRGQGLGKALVEHIVSLEELFHCINGTLKTRDAQSLYARYGFAESDVTCMSQKRQ